MRESTPAPALACALFTGVGSDSVCLPAGGGCPAGGARARWGLRTGARRAGPRRRPRRWTHRRGCGKWTPRRFSGRQRSGARARVVVGDTGSVPGARTWEWYGACPRAQLGSAPSRGDQPLSSGVGGRGHGACAPPQPRRPPSSSRSLHGARHARQGRNASRTVRGGRG